MLKPETLVKVDKLLKGVKKLQADLETLEGEEIRYGEVLLELIFEHIKTGKEVSSLDIIAYLDQN
jgi:hypothetical protein